MGGDLVVRGGVWLVGARGGTMYWVEDFEGLFNYVSLITRE